MSEEKATGDRLQASGTADTRETVAWLSDNEAFHLAAGSECASRLEHDWHAEQAAKFKAAADIIESQAASIKRLRQWVNDLHAGMYINCVYCGHRYGPNTEVPASMADVLKEHIEQCPRHPLSHCKAALVESDRVRGLLADALRAFFYDRTASGLKIEDFASENRAIEVMDALAAHEAIENRDSQTEEA